MNNLDPDVAERWQDLVVYGGIGRAARNWEAYEKIVMSLERLEGDQTLLVQSGKPVGVFPTSPDAPRVLIANSNLVPRWGTWEHFRELDRAGLMMYGQMTAGSWIYIGTQGILQGTYETFAEVGRQHFDGQFRGRVVLTAGLGGMGGAQPLAVTMNGGVCLAIDVDPARIQKRLDTRYLDYLASSLDEALALVEEKKRLGEAYSVGLEGNAGDIFPRLQASGFRPDVVTDQTSAHDMLNGYVPLLPLPEAIALRESNPDRYVELSREALIRHLKAMLAYHHEGVVTFDYGNNIRGEALAQGVANAMDFPGFVPAYIRPLFCEGLGPFRWVALSGDPGDIHRTDRLIEELFPEKESLLRWIRLAHERVAFQGLPARICWLGMGERARFGLAINDLVASGEVKAPIVIGRDHLDCGSVASPYRETENMKDGSDAVADWPLLNAMLNAVSGATWVSIHHGGGVGIGNSIHSGQVIVADGTPEAARRLERVLNNDPGTGVMRHADAGYEKAIAVARERRVILPSLDIWE